MADAYGSKKISDGNVSDKYIPLRQYCDQRLNSLRNERTSFWTHWRELADYVLPRRYKWLITPNQGNRGSPINQRIIDSTSTLALRVLAAGMMAGITNPTRPWFRMTLDDKALADDPEVKIWLAECERRMMTVFAESNFYTAANVVYEDLGCFGTAAMLIYEDFEDVIRCYNPCAGEYFLQNSERLQVNVFAREFVQNVGQVVAEYGLENCSPTVQGFFKTGNGGQLDKEVIIGHLIYPNPGYVRGGKGLAGFPYREIYWEYGQQQASILRERYFNEFPGMTPRWHLVANDAYGRSPAMDALGDIKQLQVEQKRKAQAIDKMVNPPLVADVSLKNQPATTLPGGITYVSGVNGQNGPGMKPIYHIVPPISELKADITEVQNRIKQIFFYDLFLMISQLDTVRSATEIAERKEEKLIQLGPVLERFQNEFLDPSIERTFNIMSRAKLIPPAPQKIQGRHIKVEYISILADAQKAVGLTGIERLTATIGNWAGAVPEVLDNIDFDIATDKYADMLGVDPRIVRDSKAVAAIRAARVKQQQEQQQKADAGAAVQGAQVLSQTDVGGGKNALQAMIGG